METTATSYPAQEEAIELRADFKEDVDRDSFSKLDLTTGANDLIAQIKKVSKNLMDKENLDEGESNRIAFYSFLKQLANKQKINIYIKKSEDILKNNQISFHFNTHYFLKKLDFLETIYSKVIPTQYKKSQGQFFTPVDIAEFMAKAGLLNNPKKILDPATGGGIFVSALNHNTNYRIAYTIVEKDPLCLAMAKINLSRFNDINITYSNSDFLESNEGKYDLIIANPPYIRFHDISNREDTIAKIETEIDIKLSRLTNYYALFFFHAKKLLKEGGQLIYITPSEFLNVNYGVSVKEFFKKSFEIESIITFSNGVVVFEDGMSTACITILTKKAVPDKNKLVKLIKLSNWVGKKKLLTVLINSKQNLSNESLSLTLLKHSELNYKEKWMKYFENAKDKSAKYNLVKLSEIASVKRGIATGANNYFVLSNSELNKWGIERTFFKPVIAKSNFCKFKNFTDKDFENLVSQDKQSFLLYCFSKQTTALAKYIKQGKKQKIHERYLTSKRTPWYSMERRSCAPIWAGVFSRGDVKFILNQTSCLNLTTFHGIYPKFDNENKLVFLAAFLNSKLSKELIKSEQRSYGGGLNKFEPKDLENILVPNINKINGQKIKLISKLYKQYMGLEREKQGGQDIKIKIEKEFYEILHA